MQPNEERRRRARDMVGQVFGQRPDRTTEPAAAPPEPGAEQLSLLTEIIFGEIWSRPALVPRDRSLCVVAALVALNREGELRSHIRGALRLGITREQILEIILHMGFYAGAPVAHNAFRVAREVFRAIDAS